MIVYTGRSLSEEEENTLRKHSSSIIVKGARSPERLLDEVALFLHKVEGELPAERQRTLQHASPRLPRSTEQRNYSHGATLAAKPSSPA